MFCQPMKKNDNCDAAVLGHMFVIDPRGVLRTIFKATEMPMGRKIEDIVESLKALQAADVHSH